MNSKTKIKKVSVNKSNINIIDVIDPSKADKSNEHAAPAEDANAEVIPAEIAQVQPAKAEKHEKVELDYQEDDVEEKRKRLLILGRYKNSKRFSDYLQNQMGFNLSPNHLNTLSIEELDAMINDVRYCISTKNTNGMYEKASTQGILVAENVLRPYYKIDGLSMTLSNDQTYLDLIEEIILENQNYIYVKPQYRLLYCVISSAYIVHTQHEMLEKMSKTPEGQEMIKKMADDMKKETKQNVKNPEAVKIETKEVSGGFIKTYGDLLS